MYFSPRKIKYPTKKQLEFWILKRNQLLSIEIAEQKKVTQGFVSKSLGEANERVRGLIENAAHMNKISIDVLSDKLGYARGQSHMFDVPAYITYSPRNGVQVWYEDKGECVTCEKYDFCRTVILQEFKERNLKLTNPTLKPTQLIEVLIKKLEEMIETG
ncbi:MAG: hypothetical protein ACW98I_20015 [Candidatus Hodarchaeales archaeon]|jgi:hypothetical protein